MSAARLALGLTAAGASGLVLLALLSGATDTILSIAFLALPAAAWLCAGLLFMAHRREPSAVNLGERSIVAIRDALVATIGAFLGLNRVVPLGLPTDVAVALLAMALLLVTAYPIAWLVQFFRGRWD